MGGPSADREGLDLATQTDGTIVVATGFSDGYRYGELRVARLLPNGAIDQSFGNGGSSLFASTDGYASGLALLDDGGIRLAGRADPGRKVHALGVAGFTAEGDPDTRLSGDGFVDLPFRQFVLDPALALDGNKIVVAASRYGRARRGNAQRALLIRLNSDGSPDSGFGDGGVVLSEARHDLEFSAVAVDSEHRVIAAGRAGPNMAVARYRRDGRADSSFSSDGLAVSDLGGNSDHVSSLGIDPEGRIVVAGGRADYYDRGTPREDFAVARYLVSNGPPDADADGIGDESDRCPNSFGPPPSGCRPVRSEVILYTYNGFDGHVQTGSGPCRFRRTLTLEKRMSGHWEEVRRHDANQWGSAHLGRLRVGLYRATAPAVIAPNTGRCRGDRSHPHRITSEQVAESEDVR
jgi:uncharacterized delta-60 repeat protein